MKLQFVFKKKYLQYIELCVDNQCSVGFDLNIKPVHTCKPKIWLHFHITQSRNIGG